jgi:hypothetical protein
MIVGRGNNKGDRQVVLLFKLFKPILDWGLQIADLSFNIAALVIQV